MTGRLAVVGLGPGDARWLTPEAEAALAAADALFGYGPYLDRAPVRAGQGRHASDNREEGARGAAPRSNRRPRAPMLHWYRAATPACSPWRPLFASRSSRVPPAWRALEVAIVPGITAMLAVAARVGAPLGHDFCAVSLSDNLKPWPVIERRLDAAAQAGFVIALYNPVSQARPWQLATAFERLRGHLPATTPTVFGRAVGRPDESIVVATLQSADPTNADMATLVIVGSRGDARRAAGPAALRWSTRRVRSGARAHDRATSRRHRRSRRSAPPAKRDGAA